MPPEQSEETNKPQETTTETAGAKEPNGTQLPPGQSASSPSAKVISMTSDAFGRFKRDALTQAEKKAQAALAAKLKAAGFSSMDEALAAAAAAKAAARGQQRQNNGGKPGAQASGGNGSGGMDSKSLKELQRQAAHTDVLRRKFTRQVQRTKDLREQMTAREAEMELRTLAASLGIRDPKYAIHLMRERVGVMTQEEIAKGFDEREFFGTKLRESHPFLYGETVVPVTTGNAGGGNNPPAAPKPGDVNKKAGEVAQFDARTADKAAVQKRLAQFGLDLPR